jgi:predicted ferric reductase
VGEWAGYILLAMVVIALLRRIPYRYFRWCTGCFRWSSSPAPSTA